MKHDKISARNKNLMEKVQKRIFSMKYGFSDNLSKTVLVNLTSSLHMLRYKVRVLIAKTSKCFVQQVQFGSLPHICRTLFRSGFTQVT